MTQKQIVGIKLEHVCLPRSYRNRMVVNDEVSFTSATGQLNKSQETYFCSLYRAL